MEKTVSEKIAEYALSLTLEQVPPRVLAYGKLLLLDTIGVPWQIWTRSMPRLCVGL